MSPSKLPSFSAAQIKALDGFGAGLTISDISVAANVSRQSIYTWLKSDANFAIAAAAAQDHFREAFKDRLLSLSAKALDRIERILDDPKASHGVALRAALAILNRPQFPNQGWNLPVNVLTERQERIQEYEHTIELDHKQAQIDDLTRKRILFAARSPQPDACGQNLTPKKPLSPPPLQNLTLKAPPVTALFNVAPLPAPASKFSG